METSKLWKTDIWGGIELFYAHFAEFHFAPHAHEEFMLVVTEGGKGSPRFWGEAQRVTVGDIIILNPEEVHSGGAFTDSIWAYRSFYLPLSLVQKMGNELNNGYSTPYFSKKIIHDPTLATMLRQTHILLETSQPRLVAETYLLDGLTRLLAHKGKLSPPSLGSEHQAVRVVKEMLETLPAENVSLEDLAHEANISLFNLCRVFRRDTGFSPHAYQILVRARFAKTLLAQGVPISQAALDAGFYDQAHFTRHFKRIFGVTPGRYLASA